MKLKNKTALILNGADNIAKQTAEVFLREGAEVLLMDAFSEEHLADLLRQHGKIDILVCGAPAQAETGALTEISDEAWSSAIKSDLTDPFLACRQVIPMMQKQKEGSIILISSVAGLRVAAENTVYNAMSAGLLGLMRSLATDHASEGIRINAVCTDVFFPGQKVETLPTLDGTVGTPSDFAEAILYLASAASRHVTGSTMVVDGGLQLI